ncbi:MAG: 6-bladed beta-propeller [Acidobacteriota bacterium]
MRKIFFVIPALFGILVYGADKNIEKVDKKIEDGVEVILNYLEPYKIKNVSTKMTLQEEFSIDTEFFEDEAISSVGGIEADDEGNIYVSETKINKVLVFDRNGKYLRSIGKKGEGPGEFRSLSKININSSGELITWDTLSMKFSFFKKDEALLKERKLTLTERILPDSYLLENGNYIFSIHSFDPNANYMYIGLSLYDSEFHKIKDLNGKVEIPNPLKNIKIKGVEVSVFSKTQKNKIIIGNNQKDVYEIELYDLNGKLLKKIRKEYKRVSPTEEYKKKFLELFKSPIFDQIRGRIYFPDHLPPYHNIFSDEEGRIFVETYEKGEKEGEVIFDIFTPEGVFISRKSLKKFQTGIFAYSDESGH